MRLKNRLLTILLTGIVSFSCIDLTVYATEPSSDTVSAETDAEDSAGTTAETDSISGWPAGPDITAESAIVMEAETGTIIYARNIDAKQYPASITKIMTVLVALENSAMDEIVTFSKNAVYSIERDSSHIARTDGEELTMEQCLYAVMLESANECANAVAEHIAGSIEAFADMMNAKAEELGCTGSHFVNPHGLHNEDHYVTARDMALITQAALQYEDFRTIAGAVRYTIPVTNKNDEELTMNNHHSMISKHRTSKYYDETVFAGKTGYTTDSLNTLVTCATRNDTDYICILLRAPSGVPYPETASLLDYAEENFSKIILPSAITDLPEDVYNEVSSSITGFDPSNVFLEEDTCTYTVLPNGFSADDLTASISSINNADGVIHISVNYSYENRTVGSTSWYMPVVEAASTEVQSETTVENENITKNNSSSDTLRKTIHYVVIGIAALIVILLILAALMAIRAHRINQQRRRRRAKQRRRSSSSRNHTRARRRREYTQDELDDFDDFNF